MISSNDYRDWLKATLKERSDNNPNYSLRAFARDIKLSPASISLILNGKKGLSRATADKVAKHLGLNPREQEYFKALVLTKHARTPAARQMAELKLTTLSTSKKQHTIEADHFEIVANWYHFGILQLSYLRTFQSTVPWIARQLDITEADTRDAIARLKRVGLLTVEATGKLIATKEFIMADGTIPSEAIRKFHRQIIQKSLIAMTEQHMDKRRFISTQIPIKRTEYDKIVKKMYAWNDEVANKHVAAPGEADELYAISFQLFQLNKNE